MPFINQDAPSRARPFFAASGCKEIMSNLGTTGKNLHAMAGAGVLRAE